MGDLLKGLTKWGMAAIGCSIGAAALGILGAIFKGADRVSKTHRDVR